MKKEKKKQTVEVGFLIGGLIFRNSVKTSRSGSVIFVHYNSGFVITGLFCVVYGHLGLQFCLLLASVPKSKCLLIRVFVNTSVC